LIAIAAERSRGGFGGGCQTEAQVKGTQDRGYTRSPAQLLAVGRAFSARLAALSSHIDHLQSVLHILLTVLSKYLAAQLTITA
jgi:hypothetical protein